MVFDTVLANPSVRPIIKGYQIRMDGEVANYEVAANYLSSMLFLGAKVRTEGVYDVS